MLKTNINIDQIKIKGKPKKRSEINNIKKNLKPFISKICKYDFFSVNTVNICEKIKVIPYHYKYFWVLEDYDFIKVGQLDENTINDLDITNSNEKHLLFQYKTIPVIDFDDFLFYENSPKLFILNVLESFSHLLDSLIRLNEINICFFDLCPDNIVFNEYSYPLLHNFQNSIYISKLNECFISKLIPNITDFTYKPLEVHLLFYLIKNNLNTLTLDLIYKITDKYIDNLTITILSLFSESYKEKFKTGCIDILTKYINKPKSDIICSILEQNETWDSYSISVIYLHIIGTIVQVYDLKGTFLSKLIIELMKNIHPNPSKRNNIKTIKANYEKLYEDFTDLSFIKNLPEEKLNF
jgi:hypothetical protein